MLIFNLLPFLVQLQMLLNIGLINKLGIYLNLIYFFKIVPLFKKLKSLETTCYLLGYSSHKI